MKLAIFLHCYLVYCYCLSYNKTISYQAQSCSVSKICTILPLCDIISYLSSVSIYFQYYNNRGAHKVFSNNRYQTYKVFYLYRMFTEQCSGKMKDGVKSKWGKFLPCIQKYISTFHYTVFFFYQYKVKGWVFTRKIGSSLSSSIYVLQCGVMTKTVIIQLYLGQA